MQAIDYMKQFEGVLVDKDELGDWAVVNVPHLIRRLMDAEDFLTIANDTYVPEEQTGLHKAIKNFLVG